MEGGDDDKVGYGRPPKSGQFKRGQSGNPKGRPKKAVGAGLAIQRAMAEKVPVNENGRRTRITKYDAAAKQLANKSAGGDLRATKLAFDLARSADGEPDRHPPLDPNLKETDAEIAARLIQRIRSFSPEDCS